MSDKALGFIGLGQMGAPMAANLSKAGFSVIAYDKAGGAGHRQAASMGGLRRAGGVQSGGAAVSWPNFVEEIASSARGAPCARANASTSLAFKASR